MTHQNALEKLSPTLQTVTLLQILMDRHDRLRQKAEHIPGLSKGWEIRNLEEEIRRLFYRLDEDAQRAIVALRAGHNKVWSKWYKDHMSRHPGDWEIELEGLSRISPYWYVVREGLSQIMHRDMTKLCPQWQEARSRGDISEMNRLIYEHVPAFKTLMAQVRLQANRPPLPPQRGTVNSGGEVDSVTRENFPKF